MHPKKLYNVHVMKKTLLFAAAGLCLVAAFSATRPARRGRSVRGLEPQGRRRVSRSALHLVDHLAERAARSSDVLRLVPHRAALRAGASLAASAARRDRRVARRSGAACQRHQARDDVARGRAVLPGSDARRPEDERVARHRGDSQRRHSRRAATRARIAERRRTPRARQHVGAADEDRRADRRLDLAPVPQRAVGRRQLRRSTARRSRRSRIHSAPGGYAAAAENADRVKALHAYLQEGEREAAAAQPRDAVVGVDAVARAPPARSAAGDRRRAASPRSRRTAAGARRRSDRGSGPTARRSTRAPTATPPGW